MWGEGKEVNSSCGCVGGGCVGGGCVWEKGLFTALYDCVDALCVCGVCPI